MRRREEWSGSGKEKGWRKRTVVVRFRWKGKRERECVRDKLETA